MTLDLASTYKFLEQKKPKQTQTLRGYEGVLSRLRQKTPRNKQKYCTKRLYMQILNK